MSARASHEGFDPNDAVPVAVEILTQDHEIRGIIHVSRTAAEDRRISDLLNNPGRRFLAITDVELNSRHNPSSPRHYAFLELHMDTIQMLHPSTETMARNNGYSREESLRFDQFRQKLRGVSA